MKFLFAIFITFSISSLGQTQPSDLLVLKKHGRTIKSFFPGDEFYFFTSSGNYSGFIRSINRDSIFLVQYDIRPMMTGIGVYIQDTISAYYFSVNYKQITGIGKNQKGHFDWTASGGALMGGGIILTTVGLGTWIFSKPNTQYYASPYLVGAAALMAGVGYLLLRSKSKGFVLGKKYTLEYIKVK
jgi:hypothetical protein